LFDSRPAIIGAREWGVNAEVRLQRYDRLSPSKRRPWIRCGAFLSLTQVRRAELEAEPEKLAQYGKPVKKAESAPAPRPR
jgi:hypothetical protein